MNCPPPSHSMWRFFCCVRAFFFGSIIELLNLSVTYLSVKIENFYDGDFEKKKNSGIWDLISFPNRSSFTRFTDVYKHTFMLKRPLYNT